MHVFGRLGAEVALGGLLAIAGVWGISTRKGPPGSSAGLPGLLGLLWWGR